MIKSKTIDDIDEKTLDQIKKRGALEYSLFTAKYHIMDKFLDIDNTTFIDTMILSMNTAMWQLVLLSHVNVDESFDTTMKGFDDAVETFKEFLTSIRKAVKEHEKNDCPDCKRSTH